jgi:carbon-monoxide dehydrogenase medium subunit
MKAARFDYALASGIADAVALLDGAGGLGRVMAGGQSLIPMMNLRLAQPSLVVDIAGIREMRRAELSNGELYLGAGVTHAMIEDRKTPDATNGMLPFVASGIAYRGVRNRGTIGGSLAHADPAADWPTALLALGVSIDAVGSKGVRTLSLEAFLVGAYTTALESNEVLTGVRVPRLSPKARWSYYKVARKTGEFAHTIGAAVLDPEHGVRRVVLGGTGRAPMLVEGAARRLDRPLSIADAAAILDSAGFEPVERHLHATALSRAITRIHTP